MFRKRHNESSSKISHQYYCMTRHLCLMLRLEVTCSIFLCFCAGLLWRARGVPANKGLMHATALLDSLLTMGWQLNTTLDGHQYLLITCWVFTASHFNAKADAQLPSISLPTAFNDKLKLSLAPFQLLPHPRLQGWKVPGLFRCFSIWESPIIPGIQNALRSPRASKGEVCPLGARRCHYLSESYLGHYRHCYSSQLHTTF